MCIRALAKNPAHLRRLRGRAQARGGDVENAGLPEQPGNRGAAAKFRKRIKKTPAPERKRLSFIFASLLKLAPRGYFLSERPRLTKVGFSYASYAPQRLPAQGSFPSCASSDGASSRSHAGVCTPA